MVTWKPQARAHLRNIYQYIAKDSTSIAKKVITELTECTRPLAELPFMGKVVPEAGDESLRELHAHSWRILYQVRQHEVFVIAVIHKRQILPLADTLLLQQ